MSQKQNVVDHKYVEDKHNSYLQQINVAIAPQKNVLSAFFAYPTQYHTSVSAADLLRDIAAGSGVTKTEKDFLKTCLENIHGALQQMQIKEGAPLVVSFKDFDNSQQK